MNILEYIYQDNNLTFYVVLLVISFCFMIMISISLIMNNRKKKDKTVVHDEDVIELPKVKEKIEVLDSDTFIKRLDELKNK